MHSTQGQGLPCCELEQMCAHAFSKLGLLLWLIQTGARVPELLQHSDTPSKASHLSIH